jgi:glycosyltransferase involved in cell wall biosynthesis
VRFRLQAARRNGRFRSCQPAVGMSDDQRPAPRRLLAITPTPVWPVTDGVALRIHHLLTELAAAWEITLITAARPEPIGSAALGAVSPEAALSLPPTTLRRHQIVPLTGRWRSLPSQFDTGPLVAAATQAIGSCHPTAALLWPGAEFLVWAIPAMPRAVADRIDCLALTVWRTAWRELADPPATAARGRARSFVGALRTAAAVASYERRVVSRSAATVVVGHDDAAALRRLGARTRDTRVHVIPNGVAVPPMSEGRRQPTGQPTVVFTGTLNYEPNIAAAHHLVRRVWPGVASCVPDARLVIAGRNPAGDVMALAAPPAITVVPNVADMAEVFATGWVCAAPMVSGSGVKNKVLEAWAYGLPVVMSRVASNGLPMPPGQEALVADNPGDVAALLVRFLRSPDMCARLGDEARRFARSCYTWGGAAAQLGKLLVGADEA